MTTKATPPLTDADLKELRDFLASDLAGEPPVPKCIDEGQPISRLLATVDATRADVTRLTGEQESLVAALCEERAECNRVRAQLTAATERAERAEAERGRLREADALLAETQRRLDEAIDTIRLRDADDDIARSYGRNTEAAQIAEEIRKRRGEDWSGAALSPASPAPSAEPTVTATPEAVARDEALGLRAPPPPPEPAAPLDVEAIRRRCDAATRGPWVKCAHGQAGHEDWWSVNRGVDTGRVVEALPSQVARVLSHIKGAEDAAFIAHARTDVPLLLAEIENLTSELDAVNANLQAYIAAETDRLRAAPTTEGLTAEHMRAHGVTDLAGLANLCPCGWVTGRALAEKARGGA